MKNNPRKIDAREIKDRIKITELARELGINLNKKNKTLCIFHTEKTPSLSFNDEKKIFTCFGCGKSGDIIDLYKEIKGVDTGTAIRELGNKSGLSYSGQVKPSDSDGSQLRSESDQSQLQSESDRSQPTEEDIEIYQELERFCSGVDEETLIYLTGKERGLNEGTIKYFKLFSIKDYQKTNNYLKQKFSLDRLKQSGLFNEKGNLVFFKHKVIIPFIENGKTVYLRGRYLYKGNSKPEIQEEPKIKGLSKKSIRLFNKDQLNRIKPSDKVYVCEGEFDAMVLDQEGYNSVGVCGVNGFKTDMVDLLKDYEIVLAFDNDLRGQEATVKVAKMFLPKLVKRKKIEEAIDAKDVTDFFINYG